MEPIEWIVFAAMALLEVGGSIWSNKQNKNLQEDQQSWNEKMVDKQNEYNNPANQMQMLQDAGINTAMMGENGTGSVLSNSRSASPNPATLLPMVNPFSQFGGSASTAFSEYAEGKRKLTLLQAEQEQIITNVQKTRSEIQSLGLSNEAQEILNKYLDAREAWAINEMKSNVSMNYAQTAKFKAELSEIEYRVKEILPAELQKLISENNVNVLDVQRMLAQIKDYEASADLKRSQKGLTEAETSVAGAQKGLIEAQTGLTESQDLQSREERRLVEQEADMYQQIQNKYLEKVDAEITELGTRSDLSKEQTYWKAFEVVGTIDKQNFKFGTYTEDRVKYYKSVHKKFQERSVYK